MNATRLDQIAERNTRSRIADVAFAAMVALLMVLFIASLRVATARADSTVFVQADAEGEIVAHDGTCELETETSC